MYDELNHYYDSNADEAEFAFWETVCFGYSPNDPTFGEYYRTHNALSETAERKERHDANTVSSWMPELTGEFASDEEYDAANDRWLDTYEWALKTYHSFALL